MDYKELADSRLDQINDLKKEIDRLKAERDKIYDTSMTYIDSLHEEILYLKMKMLDEE